MCQSCAETGTISVKLKWERSYSMTVYTEVVSKVKRMSQAEKLALIRVLADSLNQETPHGKRKHTLKALYGALRPKDGRIPSDAELKQDYINYLSKKYQ